MNTNENNKEDVSLNDVETENSVNVDANDSGMETTPSLINESVISEPGANSTPVATKIKEKECTMADMMNFMKTLSENINNRFDVNNSNFNDKFDEQSRKFNELKIDINEVKNKCESKCNELKRDIEKVVESVEEQAKSKSNQIVNTTVKMCIRDRYTTIVIKI